MEKKVKQALENIDSVSTTADVWTAQNRSYFGMTVHWSVFNAAIVVPGLLVDIHMMYWLLKLSTFIGSMV